MRCYLVAAVALFCLWVTVPAFAQTAGSPDAALEELLKTLSAPGSTEPPRMLRTPEGFVRFIGAPPGGRFVTEASATKSMPAPDAAAKDFVARHFDAFGMGSLKQAFTTNRVTASNGQTYVRLQQTYSGFEVLGAQALVQLDAESGVACVSTDIMRDSGKLDSGEVPLNPSITTGLAQSYAVGFVAGLHQVDPVNLKATDCTRMILDPAVVGAQGGLCVVWETKVFSNALAEQEKLVAERVFVNARNGAVAFHYPLINKLKNREIYDGGGMFPPTLTHLRFEGEGPLGIPDADLAYDYYGDTYDFYYNVHHRDSIDGVGMAIKGTVNYCDYDVCPMPGAFWLGTETGFYEYFGMFPNAMYFGEGFASADDVIAHELTHGVTQFSSGLIYSYQSGAINEAFSDIWGEFVDLTNGRGLDTDEVRWLMGEDLPGGDVIRDMQDPPRYNCPDRVGSDYYYEGTGDNGGVHYNSGVINKLCYLLTDGDTFNGQMVAGIGIEKTAKLFYECQTNLLTESSDFGDLYMALGQAGMNLLMTFDERLNVRAGARAVEIAPVGLDEDLRLFRAVPAFTTRNRPVIALYWELPNTWALRQVILVRSTGTYARIPGEGYEIYRGLGEKFLDDTGITAGVTYYYSLFADVIEGFPSAVYACATAGAQAPDFLTEEFQDADNPFDLNFCQILFSPTGPPSSSLGSSSGAGDYGNYTVTVRRQVYEFPVARGETDGAAWEVNLEEDGSCWVGEKGVGITPVGLERPFPFFQREYSQVRLYANGYMAFETLGNSDWKNFPGYSSHFSIPRISFLFADLAPKGGGDIWAKAMDDRMVCTFEYVPQWNNSPPPSGPNRVQVELFYSGHIRITYVDVNVRSGMVGLSDGRGAPQDPSELFDNLRPVTFMTDFSNIGSEPTALWIEPITPPEVEAGEAAEFTARAIGPYTLGYPSLWAEWNLEDFPTFYDEGNGTGHFRWETTVGDYGEHLVRVYAFLAGQMAYQDVRVQVSIEEPLPMATELGIRTNNPIEDPTRSRTVSDDTELVAMYTYTHPLQYMLPEYYEEGATEIRWFQNQNELPQLRNLLVVPPVYTNPNDVWCFKVLPKTLYGEQAAHDFMSPRVTILSLPEILDVVRVQDLPGIEVLPEQLPLPGVPVAYGPSSGGTEVAILGRKLSNATSVKIGGVECTSMHSVSDNRLEVVAPAHLPSPVVGGSPVAETVVVTTTSGTSSMAGAYVYYSSGTEISKADVNRDGAVDAVDVQLVINNVLLATKAGIDADVNRDGKVNSMDIQEVINAALRA